MTAKYFLLFSLVSNKIKNYWRRHFKIFTNCHVSWDTLYLIEHTISYFNEYLKYWQSLSLLTANKSKIQWNIWLSNLTRGYWKDYGTVELSREDLSQGDYISLKHSKSQQYSSRRFIFNEGVFCKIQIVIDVHVYK